MRRMTIPLVAAATLALAITGCASGDDEAATPSASPTPSRSATPTPTVATLTDTEICDQMQPAGGADAVLSSEMVESITADPTGAGIDQTALAELDERLLGYESSASPKLRTALVAYNEPIHALQQIYETGVNATITTSVGPDATALLGACIDAYEAADAS